ncbi:Protein of unknown function [Pyronema omphalodes CBS 100304]|uniref:Uncharacterized protein n=1 Tax=Pyronema omphalodes (strain CBS 100304) TaxID=1076935 RepID=U4L4L7_PYROM|nr:Protein of unknown function [Pyronema omphalodes CBS 100304]
MVVITSCHSEYPCGMVLKIYYAQITMLNVCVNPHYWMPTC